MADRERDDARAVAQDHGGVTVEDAFPSVVAQTKRQRVLPGRLMISGPSVTTKLERRQAGDVDCVARVRRKASAPAASPRATLSWYALVRSSRPSAGFVMNPDSTRIAGTSAQLNPVRSERGTSPRSSAPVSRTTAA